MTKQMLLASAVVLAVSASASAAIVAAREGRGVGPRGDTVGPFASLFDFCARVDRSRLNKRTVEALIKAGAFDSLEANRAALLGSVERAFDYANAQIANANQGGLFDMFGDDDHGASTQEPGLADLPCWGVKERLTYEKTAVGFYLSGHLFDEVEREVRRFARTPIERVVDSRDPVLLAGIVNDLRIINGQRGKVAIFKLDDKSGTLEATADEALINAHRNLLKDDELVIAQVLAQPDRFSGGLRLKVQALWDLGAARCRFGRYLRVRVAERAPDVAALLRQFPAQREQGGDGDEGGEIVRGLPLRFEVLRPGARCEVQLGEQALTFPSDAALAAWMAQAHERGAEIAYD